ncbi:MAG: DUF2971 domain-containing protein [Christensenellaceae bacterium]|nr:DUF2971 domain-containing protein [Christensenellaceae bacterium]
MELEAKQSALTLLKMQQGIQAAGGIFYQYRPCRRSEETMYDIENIRHGVVYAQTPLKMNDPFDSMIGFSADEFYDDCIAGIIEVVSANDLAQKLLLTLLLKYKVIGKMAETIQVLNEIRRHLLSRQRAMHMTHVPAESFVNQNLVMLYSSCPKELKKRISQQAFAVYARIVIKMGQVPMTAQNLSKMLDFDSKLDQLHEFIVETRDKKYLTGLRTFLSGLTVSCFSASGWDNQLMWSHYANSYSGICVEYDFSKIKDFQGFIYPVKYSDRRPTIKIQDLGISFTYSQGKAEAKQGDANIAAIMSYLLVKNTCWSYEEEWRIINVGEPDTPRFVDLPYIKSITFGLYVDRICKQLLWDVCTEKGIECFQLKLNPEKYQLERYRLTEEDIEYDIDFETKYIEILAQQFQKSLKRVDTMSSSFMAGEGLNRDFSSLPTILSEAIDMLTDAYFFKLSLNRVCSHSEDELSASDMPDEILSSVASINDFVRQAPDAFKQFENASPNLFLSGALKRDDFLRMKKHIRNTTEIIERFLAIPWHPYLLNEALDDKPTQNDETNP